MNPIFERLAENPRIFRRLVNLWFPYLGAGIHVEKIRPDWRRIDVRMRLRWYNRNYMGTHFGGSLFAMTDPFFVLMLIKNLGKDYWVWDIDARVRFIAPGRGTVRARFALSEAVVEQIRLAAAAGQKVLQTFTARVFDEKGICVAEVEKTIYIRRKKHRSS